MEIQIVELTKSQAADFWEELVPFVQRALSFDPYATVSLGDLERQVREGYARVIICARGEELLAANVVQLFKNTMGERVLHVLATAGDQAHLWLEPLIESLNGIGALEGAVAITMSGRPGWARKLKVFGFRTDNVQMRRKVNNGISGQELAAGAAAGN